LLLFLCLFRPVILTQRVREIKPVSLMLIDNSASMREHDRYSNPVVVDQMMRSSGLMSADELRDETRQSLLQKVLENPLTRLLDRLDERYDLKYYAFDTRLTPIGGLRDLNSEGNSTRMGDAVAEALKEFSGQRLSNIIVISDGRSNRGRDPEDGANLAATEQIPIYTVGVGDPSIARNIEIMRVNAPTVVLVNDEVIFKVSIAARGYDGRPVVLLLKNKQSGAVLASKDIELKGAETEQQELLYWKPEMEGEYHLEVEIPPDPEEQDVDDNRCTHLLRVESERIRVLYVDGYPRWEYRYLKNMLLRVENFEVQVFLQSADPEFIQESSRNVAPLTRFPQELKQLMEYHVILFGDVNPNQLGEDVESSDRILQNIKEYVEAGGGFLMQAGSLYSPAAYLGTPIADVLPVIPGVYDEQRLKSGPMGDVSFRMKLENSFDPPEVMKLEKDPVENRRLWEDPEFGLSGFYWYYPVERVKPGAEVWARHPSNQNHYGNHVLFATTYYPAGRTVFLAVDSTWRWRFPYGDRYHDLFWRKTVRFLAQNKLRRKDYRYDLNTDRSHYDINERIRISARIRDEDFQLSQDSTQRIKLMDPQSREEEMELNLLEEGSYERVLVARDPGVYQLWIEDEADSEETRHALTSFTVTIPQLEAENPILDETVLKNVARLSGGAYYGVQDFEKLVQSLKDEKQVRPLDDPERRDLWNSWWVLLVFTGLLGAEWILRKRQNLL
ncbi:MAG: VWA domain-containing protein, partial [Planctomycetota bacterium]